MERRPEQHELMDDFLQAKAYAESDFTESHNFVISKFLEAFPDFKEGLVVDICCGPADPTIRLAKALPNTRFIGVDGAQEMISFGKAAVEREKLADRIDLQTKYFNLGTFPENAFDAAFCNGSLHHIENTDEFWRAIAKVTKPGGPVFVMDLTRPNSEERARAIVERYAQGAPEQMRKDFFNSLLASYTPAEVKNQLYNANLEDFKVKIVSDRHLLTTGQI